MSVSNDSKQKFTAVAAVVFIALLGINAYLLYNKVQQGKTIDSQAMEIDEGERLKLELEKQYYESLSELESLRTGNEELNVLIETQKKELQDQRDKIRQAINSGNKSKRELEEARTQIAGFKSKMNSYLNQVDVLTGKVDTLIEEKQELIKDKIILTKDLDEQKTVNEDLVSEKEILLDEKEMLLDEKKELKTFVTKATVVNVADVSASAWRVRKSGKPTKTRSAAKTDRVKVCFTTTKNIVTRPGDERFYIRLISPIGETMAIESLGSGVMTTAEGDDIRYTQAKDLPYENNAVVGCFLWEPNVAFSSGKYTIEVYNKTHLAGTGDFVLR